VPETAGNEKGCRIRDRGGTRSSRVASLVGETPGTSRFRASSSRLRYVLSALRSREGGLRSQWRPQVAERAPGPRSRPGGGSEVCRSRRLPHAFVDDPSRIRAPGDRSRHLSGETLTEGGLRVGLLSHPRPVPSPCRLPHGPLTSRASRGGHSLPGPPRDARDAPRTGGAPAERRRISDGRPGLKHAATRPAAPAAEPTSYASRATRNPIFPVELSGVLKLRAATR
jgi:hypothetical protein